MPVEHRVGPQTARLEHRAFEASDAEAFHRINSNPDVMKYTGERPSASVAQARRAIEAYPDFRAVGYGRWACVLKSTGAIIGFCGLKYLPDFDEVDIGFRFLPSTWGQGFATEASAACLTFGFRELGLKRIVAFVMPENAASIRVLQKTGMTLEGAVAYDGIIALRFTCGPR